MAHCFTLLLLITSSAFAEYRVFVLSLSNAKTQVVRQVQTTLDPEQYTTIFPLGDGEKISYVDTWMCRGRTDFFKAHCDRPANWLPPRPFPDRGPAAASSQSPDIKK